MIRVKTSVMWPSTGIWRKWLVPSIDFPRILPRGMDQCNLKETPLMQCVFYGLIAGSSGNWWAGHTSWVQCQPSLSDSSTVLWKLIAYFDKADCRMACSTCVGRDQVASGPWGWNSPFGFHVQIRLNCFLNPEYSKWWMPRAVNSQ